jgi:hypothetical protein
MDSLFLPTCFAIVLLGLESEALEELDTTRFDAIAWLSSSSGEE